MHGRARIIHVISSMQGGGTVPRRALKQRPDGRYVCYCDNIAFYGHTSNEAYAARDKYKFEKAQGLKYREAGVTVEQYADRWLPIYRAKSCKGSLKHYEKILERFIAFLPDGCRIKDVTQTDIVAYYNSISDYSQSQISKHSTTIRGLFRAAVDDGLILKSPCSNATQPKGYKGTHRQIEPWERALVHQMADRHRFGVAAMLMLYAGLRRGEALAFDVDRDVDFESGRLYVREALSYTNDWHGELKDPKTAAGVRDLPLFEPLRPYLQGRHGTVVKAVKSSRLTESAFQSLWNSYLYQMSVLYNGGVSPRWIGRTKGNKLNEDQRKEALSNWQPVTIRTHDFRHSFCTMICDAGVDIKTALSWMGQSDEKMIREIYDHLTALREKKAERATVEIIEKMLVNGQYDGQPASSWTEHIDK